MDLNFPTEDLYTDPSKDELLLSEEQHLYRPAIWMESNSSKIEPKNSSSGEGTYDPKQRFTEAELVQGMEDLQQDSQQPVDDVLSRVLARHMTNIKNKEQKVPSLVPSWQPVISNSMMEPHNSSSGEETFDPNVLSEQKGAYLVSSCESVNNKSMMEPQACISGGEPSDPNAPKRKENTSSRNLESVFEELEHKLISLVKNELMIFKQLLSPDYPVCSNKEVVETDKKRCRKGVLKLTLHILRTMNQTDIANALSSKLPPACHQKLKLKLRDKCLKINEGLSTHENPAFLKEIYTELSITDGCIGKLNQEHEVKLAKTSFWIGSARETVIKCDEIFKLCSVPEKPIRIVLTQGIAGIGKTVYIQKFILDWVEGKANQDVLFMFPIPFRELNLLKNKKLSLMNLLNCFFPETQKLNPRHYKVMFIFDGLEECRLPLDFQNNESLENIDELTSVDVLLTNLIKGNLLPSALIWITSEHTAASQIPPECVDRVTEVQGFSDLQKQEYFRKRIKDQGLANKVITHVRSSRSLCLMCHIPVFCWIAATVLERMLDEKESGEIPQTLTQMFIHFLILYRGKSEIEPWHTRESILALGKLAFQQLENRNVAIYEEDLEECGIGIRDASLYSELYAHIFRYESGLHQGKVFSFVHLCMQQFLAALFVLLSFTNKDHFKQQTTELSELLRQPTMSDLLNSAVDKTLQSENRHLDIFLRFLLGLSLESNQFLLQDLLTQTGRQEQMGSSHRKKTVEHIKKKILLNACPDKSINLFHCLNEMNDHSLVQEVLLFLRKRSDGHLHGTNLSSEHWSTLGLVLLNSVDVLDEFNLINYDRSEECLLSLFPLVEVSRKALLACCNLGEKTCASLGSALQLANFLKELDLSNNDLQDSGVKLLSAGLRSSHCKLEILRLSGCMITEDGCSSLASALSSNPSHLKELDLSYNHPGESGERLLTSRLKDPCCRLDTLRLGHAGKLRIKPGVKKYVCDLTLDPNTAHAHLSLSEGNRKVIYVDKQQMYHDHPERFDGWEQVMSRESLTGRCYWEVEWSGTAEVAVTYKGISRKGDGNDCVFGCSDKSWSLYCSKNDYCVMHNKKRTVIPSPPFCSSRVGVYLDWLAGALTFYSISSDTDTLIHLHTFNTTFSEPLFVGFWVYSNSSVCLCET